MLVLGSNTNRERHPQVTQVALSPQARQQGTYIIGTTGTGKTTLLLNLILQDMAQRGAWGYEGLCVLDPHGDFTADLLVRIPPERVKDVILFDPTDMTHPFGLNLLDCNRADPRERDRVVSTLIDTLYKLFSYSWGPRMEDLLRHSILSLLLHPEPTTLLDVMLLMVNYEHRQRLTAAAKALDPILRAYWEDEFPESRLNKDGGYSRPREQIDLVSSSLNKIGRFLVNPVIRHIVGQPRSTVNFRQMMDEGKILLVNLSKGDLGADNAALLGAVLVNQLLIAALSRRDIPEGQRRPFHLYVDEYQTFATKTFPELQSEARKYAIDTVVAHQYRDQLDLENLGSTLNVANLVVLRVSGKDAIDLSVQFDNTPPPPDPRFEPVYQVVDERDGLFAKVETVGSQTGLYRMGEGARQLYSDVHLETANLLAQTPNYHAYCRVLEWAEKPKNLLQFRVALADKPLISNQAGAALIRQQSRAMAQFTDETIMQYIADHTAARQDTGGRFPIPAFDMQ
jgi:hypothetical protein